MIKEFFRLIYPTFCLACHKALEGGEDTICTFCRFELPKTNFHLTSPNPLEQRFWGKIHLHRAFAYLYFIKHGKVQKLIHHLKYKGHQEVGEMLGKWYGFELAESGFTGKFDVIVPVPLHKNKLKKRGYNQCDAFARSLSETLSIPVCLNALNRITSTSTQTKKSRFARWKNVEEIFVVNNKEEVAGKKILLIDDVVTTGSTLEACGHVLLQEGAKELSVACLAISQ
ncbi:MAG TPA: ComF family protein [Cytophagales bacterium]|nr:ComF family protein [Cytophagales bacterium]